MENPLEHTLVVNGTTSFYEQAAIFVPQQPSERIHMNPYGLEGRPMGGIEFCDSLSSSLEKFEDIVPVRKGELYDQLRDTYPDNSFEDNILRFGQYEDEPTIYFRNGLKQFSYMGMIIDIKGEDFTSLNQKNKLITQCSSYETLFRSISSKESSPIHSWIDDVNQVKLLETMKYQFEEIPCFEVPILIYQATEEPESEQDSLFVSTYHKLYDQQISNLYQKIKETVPKYEEMDFTKFAAIFK